MLKRTRPDAITLTQFLTEYLIDEAYNPTIQLVGIGPNEDDVLLPKEIPDNSSYLNIQQICKTLNNIKPEIRPIYCSDERRRQLYINTDEGWIAPSNEDEIDRILIDFFKRSQPILFIPFNNLKQHKKITQIGRKLYNMSNGNDKLAGICIQIIGKNMIMNDERDLHIKKLKVKLSQMNISKNSKYIPLEHLPDKEPEYIEEEYDVEKDENAY